MSIKYRKTPSWMPHYSLAATCDVILSHVKSSGKADATKLLSNVLSKSLVRCFRLYEPGPATTFLNFIS